MRAFIYIRAAAFLALVCVYLFTPYVAFGFDSTCECVHGGHKCGTDAYICLCCMDSPVQGDGPEFRECGSKLFIESYTQPPADVFVPPGPSMERTHAGLEGPSEHRPMAGHASIPLKPPRALS
jgi:hypothetical protein